MLDTISLRLNGSTRITNFISSASGIDPWTVVNDIYVRAVSPSHKLWLTDKQHTILLKRDCQGNGCRAKDTVQPKYTWLHSDLPQDLAITLLPARYSHIHFSRMYYINAQDTCVYIQAGNSL